MRYLALYGLTALGFFAVDFVWLTMIAKSFYDQHLGHLLRAEPLIPAAVGFYAIFLVGVVVFVVLPGLEAGSLARTLAMGALFGLVTYATFDLTCYALFDNFPGVVVAVDLAWGMTPTAGTSAIGFAAGRWLGF